MTKCSYYQRLKEMPPKVETVLDTETVFVSQDECRTASLGYQLSRYGMDSLTARLEEMRSKFGYADCTGLDFQTMQNKYARAVEYFNELPSEVRRQYDDLPEKFYESLDKDPEQAYKAGFISEELYNEYKDINKAVDISTPIPSESPSEVPTDVS